jgi:hypothetical protein
MGHTGYIAETDFSAKMALIVNPGWIDSIDRAGDEHPDLFGWGLLPNPNGRISENF